MSEARPRTTVESALRDTPPHALLRTVRSLLAERVGAQDVTLRLADYGAAVLQAVGDGPEPDPELTVPARSGTPGRAFSAQRPVLEEVGDDGAVLTHRPVTVRGDRLGLLSVLLPSAAAAEKAADELAAMADALAHELMAADRDTDLYVRSRRRKRLTLAAEMQWAMLPGRGCVRDEYTIGAHLEPAYSIGGDNFDWSSGDGLLTLSVTDGMGHGMDAALLTGLAVSALRNARRAGLGVVDQAALADQAVFAQYQGASYAASLLLSFDLATGAVEAVDAGSPRVYRMRAGEVNLVPLEPQLPLGMFEDTPYTSQTFQMEAGDRLVIVSTGVHTTASATGVAYGERELCRRVRATRLGSPTETAHAVVNGLIEYSGSSELAADASVVCVDWRGRPTP
ncbi:PP2C family protein-serine/threonine phosphatase [Streptomyces sp. SL13]|uniref:PP2C family protein-serine/threonine phosphatase n=1 Tax=Streptantibioticus silvisoli TaxID=2705255 RepID=A0AA90KFB0_9ACTN|nr:PP2C family protein-serine/threonine phosphatase [Streptantibioticus silvisoli]MDI5964399.1 PP2C family protein-serine/threonine phosphatase [Streptantibioticus silvisoli]MDI5969045.1 PP2C family protein-serine/threonine phosphatase [Streptantibioticus silvisoli]